MFVIFAGGGGGGGGEDLQIAKKRFWQSVNTAEL